MKSIPLTQGYETMVDDEDYDRLSVFKWSLRCDGYNNYAARGVLTGSGEPSTLHQMLLPAKPGFKIDHADGNGLNNQKTNLRYATHAQNIANTAARSPTGYKGVYMQTRGYRYYAAIRVDKKLLFLGNFVTKEEAAVAFNKAATLHYGEFARLNVVPC